jgi:hypothetical protein
MKILITMLIVVFMGFSCSKKNKTEKTVKNKKIKLPKQVKSVTSYKNLVKLIGELEKNRKGLDIGKILKKYFTKIPKELKGKGKIHIVKSKDIKKRLIGALVYFVPESYTTCGMNKIDPVWFSVTAVNSGMLIKKLDSEEEEDKNISGSTQILDDKTIIVNVNSDFYLFEKYQCKGAESKLDLGTSRSVYLLKNGEYHFLESFTMDSKVDLTSETKEESSTLDWFYLTKTKENILAVSQTNRSDETRKPDHFDSEKLDNSCDFEIILYKLDLKKYKLIKIKDKRREKLMKRQDFIVLEGADICKDEENWENKENWEDKSGY